MHLFFGPVQQCSLIVEDSLEITTHSQEVERKIPFLDILIIRSQVGIKTTVYGKPTHSDKYVDFKSHHPRHVMTGILGGMVDRALAICDQEYLGEYKNTH
ncbi:hypothetical protein M513_09952 [Trichuris suis]|uniref:Helix-turn-helix domain-containing protein n=1 Tax=Trichuris suis TaxID=68888 RepID=A0A085LVY2_9BILA|nr:hypothetical protein M513_09952 [Trichuris suis]